MKRKTYLTAEFIVLYAGVPVAFTLLTPGAFVLPVLWVFTLICGVVLYRDPSFNRRGLWHIPKHSPAVKSALLRFAVSALCMIAIILLVMPEEFLNLVRTKPRLWAMIMILYPLFSVIPQGIVYRAFLFHRYRELASEKTLLLLGASAFSLGHLPFGNGWALVLTLIGGLFFGSTYLKSRSIMLSSIEHAMYGGLIFTTGLGIYFLHGTLRMAISLEGG